MAAAHLHIVGDLHRQRLACAQSVGRPQLPTSCHRNLRGPYTGIDSFLRQILPDAMERTPDLVDEYRLVLLYGMPELAEIIGTMAGDMAATSDFAERTRFYGASMVRCMSQGIITFL